MRNRTSDYGAARVCKGINLRGREAYTTVPNSIILVYETDICVVEVITLQ